MRKPQNLTNESIIIGLNFPCPGNIEVMIDGTNVQASANLTELIQEFVAARKAFIDKGLSEKAETVASFQDWALVLADASILFYEAADAVSPDRESN